MELEAQNEAGQDEEMSELAEEMEDDDISLQEGQGCTRGYAL